MARRSHKNKHKSPPPGTGSRPRKTEGSWRAIDPRLRASYLYGVLVAIFGGGLFVFPVKVDPIEALALVLGMTAMAVVLHGYGFRQDPNDFFRKLGGLPAFSVFALALWGFVRWKLARFPAGVGAAESVAIPSAGRDAVIALLCFATAFAFGLGLGFLKDLQISAIWRSFRSLFVLAAFGFSLLGIYQFFFGYELMLERLREAQVDQAGMDPLLLQSLEYALQERRVGGTLGNGNIFAALLSILALTCLSWVGRDRPARIRAMAGAGFLLAGFALLLTGSRGGILTMLVVMAGAALVHWKTGGLGGKHADPSPVRSPAAGSSIPLLLGGATLLIARSAWAIDITYRLTRITTIRERLNYWSVAVKIWAADVLAGGGPGAFELFYPRLKALTARESRFAHSWVFQTGSELGLIGLGLFLLFWVAIAVLAFKAWRGSRELRAGDPPGVDDDTRERSREALWLALICAVLAFNGLFEYSLHTAEFLVLLGLCSGGLVGLMSRGDSAPVPGSFKQRTAVSALLLVCVLLAALVLIPRSQLAANWEWKAEGAALSGEPLLAAGYYARASRLLPDDERLVLRRSGALMQIPGREAEAEGLLERAESLNPLSARIRSVQALHYEREELFDLAIRKMDEAVELYPVDAGYRLQRAGMLHRLGRDDAARADLQFVEEKGIPIWAYLRPDFDDLREELGLPPTEETLRERERAKKRKAREARSSP
jgi:tetratricopeptide (TPR) repeat protein/uncharacterized membrane protein (Fun14 family)